jgi:hypothetical protein
MALEDVLQFFVAGWNKSPNCPNAFGLAMFQQCLNQLATDAQPPIVRVNKYSVNYTHLSKWHHQIRRSIDREAHYLTIDLGYETQVGRCPGISGSKVSKPDNIAPRPSDYSVKGQNFMNVVTCHSPNTYLSSFFHVAHLKHLQRYDYLKQSFSSEGGVGQPIVLCGHYTLSPILYQGLFFSYGAWLGTDFPGG